jgi:hypothetical protein
MFVRDKYVSIIVATLSLMFILVSCTSNNRDVQTVSGQNESHEADFLVSVDNIEVDYQYTDEMVTILYPLYGDIFDDFLIVTATNNNTEPVKVIVKSEIVGYSNEAVDTVSIQPGDTIEIRQNPLLKSAAIDELNTQRLAEYHIEVKYLDEGEQKTILEDTQETLVFARRDFPWSIEGFTEDEVWQLIAAMVTPNDPKVEELIRYAADNTESGMMWSGYGDANDDQDGAVWERLEAIWDAETEHYDLTYINTWVSYAADSTQRIRLPAETLEQGSGNCIELALLFASAAEAIDLEAALIRIPGHAYVAVRTDQENANYYFVETTMIGRTDFEAAVQRGAEEWASTQPKLEANEPYYDWVKIWEARENGILPLSWH